MLELLTGTGLAAAAGLNAYIPLLTLGLASRFLDFVQLPAGWSWLSNEWVLVILGVLLILEIVADKVPVVDNINDWVQTVVRPVAGGIVFGGGANTETHFVTDPDKFFSSNQWVPVVVGVVIALAIHLVKMSARPVINTVTLGMGGAAASTVEDAGAIGLSLSAVLLPVFVIVMLGLVIAGFVALFRRLKKAVRAKSKVVEGSV